MTEKYCADWDSLAASLLVEHGDPTLGKFAPPEAIEHIQRGCAIVPLSRLRVVEPGNCESQERT